MIKGTLLFFGGVVAGIFAGYAAKKSWYSKGFAFLANQSKKLEIAINRA